MGGDIWENRLYVIDTFFISDLLLAIRNKPVKTYICYLIKKVGAKSVILNEKIIRKGEVEEQLKLAL